MKTSYKTEQELFWKGAFGDEYIARNNDYSLYSGDLALFADILKKTQEIKSVIEFGSNIGLNLKAIKTLIPNIDLSAIEINHSAAEILRNDPQLSGIHVYEDSILNWNSNEKFDFVLIKGVLIHINPDELKNVYKKLYDASEQYICMVEYYNPTPVTVEYRGNKDKLFKRDFCGEFMDQYKDFRLVDYGFVYHRANHFQQDDANWFLLEKK